VPEAAFLRPEVVQVAAVRSGGERLDGDDVDARSPQAVHLSWVVGEQAHRAHAERLQHCRGVGVVAGIDR
jgi:hypothetical protein